MTKQAKAKRLPVRAATLVGPKKVRNLASPRGADLARKDASEFNGIEAEPLLAIGVSGFVPLARIRITGTASRMEPFALTLPDLLFLASALTGTAETLLEHTRQLVVSGQIDGETLGAAGEQVIKLAESVAQLRARMDDISSGTSS